LNDQHHFVNAGANRVDGDYVAFLIGAIRVHKPRDKQLASVQALVFSRRDYSSNNSSKNHNLLSVVRSQWSVVSGQCLGLATDH